MAKTKLSKSEVKIEWSIHECKKLITNNKLASSQTGYMTVKKVGRKKEYIIHDTLGSALNHVGV